MREYVWRFASRPDWTRPDGLRLQEFGEWIEMYRMARHEALTLAFLIPG